MSVVLRDECFLSEEQAKTPYKSCLPCYGLIYPFAKPEPYELVGRVALFALESKDGSGRRLSHCYSQYQHLATLAQIHEADGVLLGQVSDLGFRV